MFFGIHMIVLLVFWNFILKPNVLCAVPCLWQRFFNWDAVCCVYLLCCSCLIQLYGYMVQENDMIANDTGLLLKALCCSFYESAI